MQRNSGVRLVPLFITFVIVIAVIVAAISIGRAIFGNKSEKAPAETTDVGRDALLNTSANRSVRFTTRGPIVADENFKSYTIQVTPTERTMNIYTGYLEDITENSTNANNQQAYEEFVYALDKAEMMKGIEPEDDKENDLRGICATGYIYDYAVLSDETVVKHLWTSTCDGSKGSLDANVGQLNSLFHAQIPDSNKLIPFSSNPLKLSF